ncbi:hypothetical protein MsAc7_12530 [Methanolapillus millepedarum]|uniref:HEPN domain-containing protein n=2 Tax=Methanolapillus millepedarum TaxID=3028296 RepID=A0AA96V519_9EURY|nr:hypothetical protein MsAc7_12530 [Methanosarcinaceae archaeon Ac7]
MAFPEDFIDISKWLNQKGNQKDCSFSEAAYRSAINRAYYAAFLYAESYAIKYFNYQVPKGKNSHLNLVKEYGKSESDTHQKIGKSLERMKQLRKRCDYEKKVMINLKSEAKKTIQEAEEIIVELKKVIKDF